MKHKIYELLGFTNDKNDDTQKSLMAGFEDILL